MIGEWQDETKRAARNEVPAHWQFRVVPGLVELEQRTNPSLEPYAATANCSQVTGWPDIARVAHALSKLRGCVIEIVKRWDFTWICGKRHVSYVVSGGIDNESRDDGVPRLPCGWKPYVATETVNEMAKCVNILADVLQSTAPINSSAFVGAETQSPLGGVQGYAPADTLHHDHGINPARLSEAKNKGKVRSTNALPGQLDSRGRKVRIVYNIEDALKHCSPKHVKEKTRQKPFGTNSKTKKK